MAFDNTNTGALFKNDKKETANQPDYQGNVNVGGREYWLSAWIKPMKNDPSRRYMSIALKPKQADGANPVQAKKPSHDATKARQLPKGGATGFDDFEDNPPF